MRYLLAAVFAFVSLDDRYWERTTARGDIIDNNFATHAKKITVTVRSTDGSFTADNCGSWDRARRRLPAMRI